MDIKKVKSVVGKMNPFYAGLGISNYEALSAGRFRAAAGYTSRGNLSKTDQEKVDKIKARKELEDNLHMNVSELVSSAETKRADAIRFVLDELSEAQETIEKLVRDIFLL